MANKSITASDRRQAQDNILETSSSQTSQSINITDIVSEGEIKGLVNGGESIFFNEDALFNNDESNYSSGDLVNATGNTNSTTVTITGDTKQTITSGGNRFLVIRDALNIQVSLSGGGTLDSGFGTKFTLTGTNSPFKSIYQHDTGIGFRFDDREIAHGDGLFRLQTLSKGVLVGTISTISNSDNTCVFKCPDSDFEEFETETSGTRTLSMDLYLKISNISPTSITVTANPPLAFTNSEFGITEAISNGLGNVEAKYPGSRYQIAPGTQTQPMFNSGYGTGSITANITPSPHILKRGGAAVTITAGSVLTGGQQAEVDEVVLLFSYPSGMSHSGGSVGKIWGSAAAYRVEVGIKKSGESDFSYETLKGNYGPNQYGTTGNDIGSGNNSAGVSNSGEFVLGHLPRGYRGESAQRPFTTEVSIDLVPYQPFTDFQIKITRLTNHGTEDGGVDYTNPVAGPRNEKNKIFVGVNDSDYNENSPAVISSATAYIKEKLNYPFTALINTQFNSQQFGSVPKRSYELYGIKVQVPSNYVTREENLGSTYPGMESKYTRNTSTGAITGTNQPWDGNFRAEKVYTNNPAWVFYDILVNNRYGLGGFLKAANIDKFSLYKIGKYCDELVPDGKLSKEPRFTANLYLQKATDAYKVLKDMATIFRGMLYWINGEVRPVMDEKKSPVYNFSKANVIDGLFSYEGAGSKTRANQYIVTWNNPETGYKLEPLIVEDKQNIAETGRIISQQAVAFGCTSQGQALRYGRWKLWTAINQTEIVTFGTGEAGAFLTPGDVVNIQDADQFDIPFSGRVSSYSESGSVTLTLDRDIDPYLISNDYTYTVSVIVPKTVAILNQDSATINSTSYSRGDTVVQARLVSGASYSTLVVADREASALNAANALDDSNDSIDLVLRESTIVQERPLTGSLTVDSIAYTIPAAAVNARTTLQLGSALDEDSAADLVETLWVIKQTKTSVNKTTASSPKQYKLISVSDDGEGTYGIAAVEHYNEKFDSIENEFTVAVDDPVFPPEPTATPPGPTGLRILRVSERSTAGEEVIVQWDAPTYDHIKGYELTHFFNKERANELRVLPGSQTQVSFGGIEDGRYSVEVRTISEFNKKSKPAIASLTIEDIFSNNVPRINGIQKGCIADSAMQMALDSSDNKTGTVFFANGSYFIAPLNAIEATGYLNVLKQNDSSNSSSITQSVAEISEGDWAGQTTTVGRVASVFYDFSNVSSGSADPLRLISWKIDNALAVNYWYDADKYAANSSSIWVALGGTAAIAAGSNKVVGTNTAFTALAVTDVVKISNTFGSNIAFIESDTVMYLSSVSDTNIAAGTTIYRDELAIDYRNDFLCGEVTYISNAYNFTSYVSVREDQRNLARGIIITSDMPTLSYDASTTIQSVYSSITLDIQALNYTDPEIKVTGSGFNQTNQSVESSFTSGFSRQLVVHSGSSAIAYSGGSKLDFVVEAREKNNTSRTRTSTYSITKTIDDNLAGAGFTATFSPLDFTYRMNSLGVISNSASYVGVASIINAGTVNNFATSGTSANTYGASVGGETGGLVSGDVILGSANNQLSVTIRSTANIIDEPSSIVAGFVLTIFDRSDSNSTIAIFRVQLSKIPLVTRNGVSKTFDTTDTTFFNAWKASGNLTTQSYQDIAATAMLSTNNSADGSKPPPVDGPNQVQRIVSNDKLTFKLTNVTPAQFATRIFIGASAETIVQARGNTNWSVPVVEQFPGSVIVDGTLSASSIAADSATINDFKVGSLLTVDTGGKIATPGKTFANSTKGFFVDTDGNFALGDGSNNLRYTAASGALALNGTFSIAGPQGDAGAAGDTFKEVHVYKNSAASVNVATTYPNLAGSVNFDTGAITWAGSATNANGWYASAQAPTSTYPRTHRRSMFVQKPSTGTAVAFNAQSGTSPWGISSVFTETGPTGPTSTTAGPAGPTGTAFYTVAYSSDTDADNEALITQALVAGSGHASNNFSGAIGRYSVVGDICVVSCPNATGTNKKSFGFRCTANMTSTNNGNWADAALFISGDLIVDGSIGGTKIVAGSINTDKLIIGAGPSSGSRIRLLSDKMEVWNNNALRVKLGNLT